jgi:TPR repeat protein
MNFHRHFVIRFFSRVLIAVLGAGVACFSLLAQDSAPEVISKKSGGVQWKNLTQLKAAAANGNPLACAQLGELLLRGDGVPQNGKLAVELLEKAARANIASAAFRLGMLFDDGDGVAQDQARAVAYFRAAAAGDYETAYHNVGAAYVGGRGVKRDYVEALGWLILAKKRGVGADSEQALRGQILKRNHPEWIAAGEKRALEIEHELGSQPPSSFLPPPAPVIFSGNTRADSPASGGPGKGPAPETSNGLVTLGAVKVGGENTPPPPGVAEGPEIKIVAPSGFLQRWPSLGELQRAADRGEPAALSALGQVFLEGKFAPADPDRAVTLLERGAKAGSADAALQLANLYTQGGKIPADATKAFQYNLQAARGGAPQAMFNTGALLSNGLGAERNFTEALAWLILAKQHGRDPGSEQQIRDYLTKTAPQQIPIAEKRAAELQREIAAAPEPRS